MPITTAFPDADWWKQFNDPNLNNYISLALSNNFSLKAAIARIAEAKAVVNEVKSIERPNIFLNGSFQRQRTSGSQPITSVQGKTYNLYTLPLQATYQLDIFGQNRLQIDSAKKLEQEAEVSSKIIELEISSEVAGAYFNLMQTDALIKTTQALIENRANSVKLRRQLFVGGVIPYDTVLLTEQQLAAYSENLAQYKSSRSIFAHQLNVLMGLKPINEDQIKRSTIDQSSIPLNVDVGIPSEIVIHRPDVEIAEIALQKANIDVKQARRQFFPTFNLNSYIGYQSQVLAELFDWKSRIYEIGASALQSLYTGGYNTANLKYKKAVAQEQLNNYFSVLIGAFGDVENSIALFKDNYAQYNENIGEIKTSQHYAGLAQVRYTAGVGTSLDYLDAESQVLSYQLLAYQNKSQSLIDIVSIYNALGGGLAP